MPVTRSAGSRTKTSAKAGAKTKRDIRDAIKKGNRGAGGLVRIPKEDINVRFLTEMDEWVEFFQWFDGDTPHRVLDRDEAPANVKVTQRFACNALDVDDDLVILLEIPTSVAKKVLRKEDKFNTIMDRDYTLGKIGEGLSTEYDVSNGPQVRDEEWSKEYADRIKSASDIENIIINLENEDGAATSASKSKGASSRRRTAPAPAKDEDDDEPEDDDDDEAYADDDADDDNEADDEPDDDEDDATAELSDTAKQILEAGTNADDNDDQDAVAFLEEACGQALDDKGNAVDPNEYATWTELAQALVDGWGWEG